MVSPRKSFRAALFFLFFYAKTTNSFVVRSEKTLLASLLRAADANEGSVAVSRSDGSKHHLAYRIVRPMSLSSRQAAPIVALHGGPSVPSNYLYPLEQVVPYRAIVFYDQLGCGKSDEPSDLSQYSIQDSVQDLKNLLEKLGVRRFHLYGQSYGGILAFEYMKHLANTNDNGVECLSAVLSSAPTNVKQIEAEADRLIEVLKSEQAATDEISDEELNNLFQKTHQCRLEEMPKILADAYANAGTVWRGTAAIADYAATPPKEDAARMPSSMILRGEYDFVSEESVEGWKSAFNTKFLRYKTLEGCSHHGMLEKGDLYGDTLDSYFGEYD
eukprot:CAMPEP_0194255428 /NCGR_PEP_ID=MMETSP0158-20130606/34369_1 /TAXON_ID=33649 /ORGANISM="Thalassionema nitzschioides, Strain L26-B" /LENGTH=328 /DNA_ID=CAMNT_0038993771 /DNA_START=8 /DNA_END=994 /DNA_ORIENTATION=+